MKTNTTTINLSSRFFIARIASIIAAFTTAFIALCSTQTRADTIALSFTGGLAAPATETITAGWAFSLSTPIELTQLGLWDRFDNGLQEAHAVTVWTSTGTQLAQATIPGGTSPTLTDGFRYVSLINPLVLPAGDYTIGGLYNIGSADLFAISAATISPASGVTYTGSRFAIGDAFPTGDAGSNPNSYFGPNFQFTAPTSVPDAGSTCTLVLLGLTATFGLNSLLRKRA
jgi:hypothetical protein